MRQRLDVRSMGARRGRKIEVGQRAPQRIAMRSAVSRLRPD
jgi:hypothetical protein